MRLRVGIAALALAVAAPVLSTAPASAKADPIDPDALASLKAAFTASGQAFGDRGGTIRVVFDFELQGRPLHMRTVQETDALGHSYLRDSGIPGYSLRSKTYYEGKRKPVAALVAGPIARALKKHGLDRVPRWYVPTRHQVSTSVVTGADLTSGASDLERNLVSLSATTDGDRVTYHLTTDPGVSPTVDETIVTDHGLITSLSGNSVSLTLSYGHGPIPVPKAGSRHSRLIEAENLLRTQATTLATLLPKHKPRAKRVAWLQRTLARATGPDIRVNGVTQSVRRIPRGVEVTGTIKSWKHPLTWRYLVTKKGIAARPVRTV